MSNTEDFMKESDLTARNRKGKPITYSGKEDHNVYTEELDTYLIDKGLYDILDESEEFLETLPTKPTDAIERRRDGRTPKSRDNLTIEKWNAHIRDVTKKAGVVLGIVMKTFSEDIVLWIANNFPEKGKDRTVENIRNIREGVKKKFGGYNHHKGKMSAKALENMTNFTNAKSITIGINKINALVKEREAWSNLTVTSENPFEDYRFKDEDIKEAVMSMMEGNNELAFLLNDFRLNSKHLSYARICDRLTDQASVMEANEDRSMQKLKSEKASMSEMENSAPSESTAMFSNHYTKSQELNNDKLRYQPFNGICYYCGARGHRSNECNFSRKRSFQQTDQYYPFQQVRQRQMQRGAPTGHFQQQYQNPYTKPQYEQSFTKPQYEQPFTKPQYEQPNTSSSVQSLRNQQQDLQTRMTQLQTQLQKAQADSNGKGGVSTHRTTSVQPDAHRPGVHRGQPLLSGQSTFSQTRISMIVVTPNIDENSLTMSQMYLKTPRRLIKLKDRNTTQHTTNRMMNRTKNITIPANLTCDYRITQGYRRNGLRRMWRTKTI